jgi:hypothetical protein
VGRPPGLGWEDALLSLGETQKKTENLEKEAVPPKNKGKFEAGSLNLSFRSGVLERGRNRPLSSGSENRLKPFSGVEMGGIGLEPMTFRV